MKLPKIVVGSATLSPEEGEIKKIAKGLAGGFDVTVGKHTVHVAKGLELKVRVGQHVLEGDPLSNGTIKPQDLVKHKGMNAAQDYIASELKSAYQGMGQNIHRKTFETVVRSLGNTTRVVKASRDSTFVPGDIAPYSMIEHHNKNLEFLCTPEEAIGRKLAKAAGGLPAGHEVTQKDAITLKAKGLHEVAAMREAIVHAPILKGMSTLPILRKDWMAALGYQHLAKVLTEGASQGWATDLADYHPIPAFAHGATFGQGEEGKY
jgi:DNA-directed RNA polymerase subunit beta'